LPQSATNFFWSAQKIGSCPKSLFVESTMATDPMFNFFQCPKNFTRSLNFFWNLTKKFGWQFLVTSLGDQNFPLNLNR
jgi:hypothetical protein